MNARYNISWIIESGNPGEIKEKVWKYFERVVKYHLDISRKPLRIDGTIEDKEEVSKQVVCHLVEKAKELSLLRPKEFDRERMYFVVSSIVYNSADLKKYLPYEDLNIYLFNLVRWYESSGDFGRAADITRELAEDFFGKGESQMKKKNYAEAGLFFGRSEEGYTNALRLLNFNNPNATSNLKKRIAAASLYNKICMLYNSNGKWISLGIRLLEFEFRLRWDIGFTLLYFILYNVIYLALLALSWRLYGEMSFTQYFRAEFAFWLAFYVSLAGIFIGYYLAVRGKNREH
ncbi:MAG: hypothetical protein HXS44_11865 [Theionarchaea archaeon]|nr:hypothetical protein [Theionarchaea archaeon]